MSTPKIVTVREFNTSRFAQLADTADINLTEALLRAEKSIESKLKRPIVPTTFVEFYRPTDPVIYLRKRPVISVENVRTGRSEIAPENNTHALNMEHIYINQEQGYINTGRSYYGYVVRVEYTAGFENIPEDLKEAVLLQAALNISPDMEIYGTGDSKAPVIRYMKDDIADLLAPYKQLHLAWTGQ